jgi:O-antigen ligase
MIMGQTSDPNYFVGFFIFPLTVALKKLVSKKHTFFYLILIAVSLYCVFLSGSRGGFLAIAVTIAGFAFLYPSGFAKRILLMAGGAVSLFVLWTVFKPILPENIVERMSVEAVAETGGTGRWDIWKSMIREIVDQPENLLLGRGITAMHRLFVNGKWSDAVAHNQLLQTIYNQGLIGLFSFLFLTGICFFRCVKRRKTVSIAILGMMALSVSLSFNQTTRTFWNLIAYAAFAFPDSDTNTINNGGLTDNEHI